jgi:adenylate kinase
VNVVIFGPPGAGKGTQAQNIAKKFNLNQISTGDLLRSEIKKKTEIGKEIESIISEGDFATDDIVNKLLNKVITDSSYKNRIIFDGYPRNISQAKNLKTSLSKDSQSIGAVLYLYVSRNIIEKRIIGRITCEKCNKTLNEFSNTKEEIENHECGKDHLKRRKDDNYKNIDKRYDTYMERTKPVLDFYSSLSYFHEIDGSQKIEVITSKIEHILNL